MGTGIGAAEEGKNAGNLMKQMLKSGFPPEYVLQNINSILILRGQAGAVTVDLAEIRLDTGRTTLYKWGAAASWFIRNGRAEKIGTATPPPGISMAETREAVRQLSRVSSMEIPGGGVAVPIFSALPFRINQEAAAPHL